VAFLCCLFNIFLVYIKSLFNFARQKNKQKDEQALKIIIMTAIEFNHGLTALHTNLTNFARSLTCDTEAANDLTQETMLKALDNREKFHTSSNMKAWTFTIMKNTFINNYRRSKRNKCFVDTTDNLIHINSRTNGKEYSPNSHLNTSEILRVVDDLREEHRIPFMMHFEGYKYKEIADKLQLSIGTVKSRIFFGRKKMMGELLDYAV